VIVTEIKNGKNHKGNTTKQQVDMANYSKLYKLSTLLFSTTVKCQYFHHA